ncbi:1136_t:CDS:2 [Paraglomus brasilianum]|uniref:1136_t:CDS:1 n=1 Tax=Paraglomus brasilianum TaxID=144538 RepID=A0A9N9DI42_9GLOM|nr:1136_t:CDS:2 [Paraglomus brasilianum]
MATVTYPVFSGTNPKSWLAQLERAMKANGVADNNNDKRLGIAACHMGPYQEWIELQQITKWDNDNTKREALEIASKRMQKPGEPVEVYKAALEIIWQECDPAEMTDRMKLKLFLNGLSPMIRMSVKQQAPVDINAAVRLAKVHSRAVRDEMKPEVSSTAKINEAMAGEIQELKQKLEHLEKRPNPPPVPEHTHQSISNIICYYCHQRGHRQADCKMRAMHRQQGKQLTWNRPR